MADPKHTPHTSEYRTGSDPRTLRDALGCFATGVTVVTCFDSDQRPFGITANSFTSVSLEPPLLLVCVHKMAACAAALTSARHFAINVLQTASNPPRFAFRPRQDRFGNAMVAREFGAPVLGNSLSVFECERHAVHEGGDHHIWSVTCAGELRPSLDPCCFPRPLPPAALRLESDQVFGVFGKLADDEDDHAANDEADDEAPMRKPAIRPLRRAGRRSRRSIASHHDQWAALREM